MNLQALLLLVAIPAVLVLGLTVVSDRVLRRARPVPMDARFPGLRGAWGITDRSRVLGVVTAALVLVGALSLVDRAHGLSLVLAPALAATTALLVQLVGQRVVGRRLASTEAGIEVRSVDRYAPRGLRATTRLGIALTALALGLGGWYGSYGRQFDYGRGDGVRTPFCHGSLTPFLGPYYVLPLAGVGLVLVAVAFLAVRLTAARPRNGAEPAIVVADDEVRRRATTAMLATLGVGVWGSLALALTNFWTTAHTLRSNAAMPGGCGVDLPGWWEATLGGGALVAAVVTLWCLARALNPGGGQPVEVLG